MLSWGLLTWFKDVIKLQDKKFWVKTLPPVLLFGMIGIIASSCDVLEVGKSFQYIGAITTNVACNLVLGLLLVFRTNSAYERFWQGRNEWGKITVNVRNLAREIQICIIEEVEHKQKEKTVILKLLGAFVITTKLHLRQQPFTDELNDWIEEHYLIRLQQSKNVPLEISFWISDYIHQAYQRQKIDSNQQVMMVNYLNQLITGLTSCDRIRTTPIPFFYRNFLKKILFIYCAFLPFSLVPEIHGWTGFSVTIISLVLLSIEEMANQIEDPFGNDDPDLPLDDICQTILTNIESAIAFGESQHLTPDSVLSHFSEKMSIEIIDKT